MNNEAIIRKQKWISKEEAKKMFNFDIDEENGMPIPKYTPSFEEIAKQMRINCDILKKEFSDHVNEKIERYKRKINE